MLGMGNNIVLIIALAVSVAWGGISLLVPFSELSIGDLVLAPDMFDRWVLIILPIAMIWLVAASIIRTTNIRSRVRDLENEVEFLKEQVTNHRRKLALLDEQHFWEGESIPENRQEFANMELEQGHGSSIEHAAPMLQPEGMESYPDMFSKKVLVRALSFAEHDEDTEGFAAIDAAVKDPEIAAILELSMDVLRKLAEAGISIDQLPTDLAVPDVWRRVAANESRVPLPALGGIGTREDLKVVSRMLDVDMEFREYSSKLTSGIVPVIKKFSLDAQDDEILAFANSRTIRACILLEHVLIEA